MLKIPIKGSQVANLTDARYFAAWQVEWLGFCLDESAPSFLRPAEFNAIREWVEGPKVVGEFGLQKVDAILELAKLLKLPAVQVGPFLQGEALAPLQELEVFKEIVVETGDSASMIKKQLELSAPYVDQFVLDFSKNGWTWESIQESADWGLGPLQVLCKEFPLWLDLGIAPAELERMMEKLELRGLSLKGGEEEKVGVKSYDELDEILEALEDF